MTFKDYKHFIPVQIRFHDIDRLNHVNNACYMTYFESGRVDYFQKTLRNHIDWSKNGVVVARSEINHIKPIYLNDEIFCFTKLVRFGNKSMAVENAILKKTENDFMVCAEGIGILVAMDYINNKSIRVPDLWRSLIGEFEKI
jgi:acyl-CoA thioester hydrolase